MGRGGRDTSPGATKANDSLKEETAPAKGMPTIFATPEYVQAIQPRYARIAGPIRVRTRVRTADRLWHRAGCWGTGLVNINTRQKQLASLACIAHALRVLSVAQYAMGYDGYNHTEQRGRSIWFIPAGNWFHGIEIISPHTVWAYMYVEQSTVQQF